MNDLHPEVEKRMRASAIKISAETITDIIHKAIKEVDEIVFQTASGHTDTEREELYDIVEMFVYQILYKSYYEHKTEQSN